MLMPATSDPYVTQDIADNWGKVDDHLTGKICTSTTHPTTWTSAHNGMVIAETDTGLAWRWTGTTFVRTGGTGLLHTSGGGVAAATRTTDFTTSTSSSLVVVLAVTSVVVPAGNRPLLVIVEGSKAENSSGSIVANICRSNVNNQGPFLGQTGLVGDSTSPTPGAQGPGFVIVGWELSGVAAGIYNWSFQIRSSISAGGTSYIRADSLNICRIAVVEL